LNIEPKYYSKNILTFRPHEHIFNTAKRNFKEGGGLEKAVCGGRVRPS